LISVSDSIIEWYNNNLGPKKSTLILNSPLIKSSEVKKGNYFQYVSITQIAPTICELLQINQTNGCISDPLNEFFISK
jgi:hypothetical protein